jgi:hypothetical protein
MNKNDSQPDPSTQEDSDFTTGDDLIVPESQETEVLQICRHFLNDANKNIINIYGKLDNIDIANFQIIETQYINALDYASIFIMGRKNLVNVELTGKVLEMEITFGSALELVKSYFLEEFSIVYLEECNKIFKTNFKYSTEIVGNLPKLILLNSKLVKALYNLGRILEVNFLELGINSNGFD